MSDYASQWARAKKTYEDNTGKKKPAESDGKWYEKIRSKSGVAAELKAIDKLIPANLADSLSDKQMKKVEEHLVKAKTAADKYVVLVNTAIGKEKALGKATSDIYRDLKLLRATLDTIIASIEQDVAKMHAARSAAADGAGQAQKVTYIAIKSLAEGIDRNAKQALMLGQAILKDPRPETYNKHIQKATRDFTQQLANIRKWTMPELLHPTHANNRMLALQDPGVYKAVERLYHKVATIKAQTLPFVQQTGSTPMDASLGKMAEDTVKLPLTATPAEVTAAAKYMMQQIKAAMAVRAGMTR